MAKRKSLSDAIRHAIKADGRSLYRLELDSGVSVAVLSRFVRKQRELNLGTADRLCKELGLEIRPVQKAGE